MCITNSVHRLLAAAGIAAAVTLASDAKAQSAFTYQGVLEENGEPVTGSTRLRFALFNAPTGGVSYGGLVVQTVDIDDGVFTATPNFGPLNMVDLPDAWLEVAVETSPGAYETLGRQQLTAAPFALNTRGISVLPNNNVGIGTDDPQRLVHVSDGLPVQSAAINADSPLVVATQDTVVELVSDESGAVGTQLTLKEVDSGSGAHVDTWGILRRTSATGTPRLDFSYGTDPGAFANPSMMSMRGDTGRVGIGTENPARRLHLRGADGFMLVERNNNPAGVILRTFDDDTYTTETSEWRMLSGNDGNFQLQNANNGFSTPFIVTPNNRVGIGTDSPTNLLEISGDSNPGVVINNTTEDTKWVVSALNNGSLGFYDSFTGHNVVEIISETVSRMLVNAPNGDKLADIGMSNNRSDAGRVTVSLGGLSTSIIDHMADGTAFMFTDTYLTSSDARLKENIKTIADPIATVAALRGVTYDRIDGSSYDEVGFIAQEVEQVLPQLVHTDREGMKSVAYDRMTALLVEAVKAQQAEIESLQGEIESLKAGRTGFTSGMTWPMIALLGLGGITIARRRESNA